MSIDAATSLASISSPAGSRWRCRWRPGRPPRGQVPNYVNGYAVQSSAYTVPFNARGAADAIQVPVLIIHSERALTPSSVTPSTRR